MLSVGTLEDVPFGIQCAFCGEYIWLHRRTLENIDGNQATRSDVDPNLVLAIGCPSCSKVLSIQAALLTRSPAGRLEPALGTWHVQRLRCDSGNCKFRIELYGLWPDGLTGEQRRAGAATWIWENVSCPTGHRIQRPIWE